MTALIPSGCLAVATIIMEAGGEPYEGKLAVAHVIRERTRLKYSSDGTVADTVLRPWQFSAWNTDSRARGRTCNIETTAKIALDCFRAWDESEAPDPSWEGVVLYHADRTVLEQMGLHVPSWAATAKFVRRVGRHLFYRDKGH